MTPEQAKFLFDTAMPQVISEFKTTRRVVAAMPEDQLDYRPSEKCMTARELATHILTARIFFLNGVATGAFSRDAAQTDAASVADMLSWFDTAHAAAVEKMNQRTPEQLAETLTFYSYSNPAVAYINFCLMHEAHHRGQLAAYLRPMGGKVPSIYGGSADEPMQPPAKAKA
ncbi:MAG: DinB family protein [Bryobacteraceae bacterium]|nr:DinB family protein [Bryobacteraceae bacterium]